MAIQSFVIRTLADANHHGLCIHLHCVRCDRTETLDPAVLKGRAGQLPARSPIRGFVCKACGGRDINILLGWKGSPYAYPG